MCSCINALTAFPDAEWPNPNKESLPKKSPQARRSSSPIFPRSSTTDLHRSPISTDLSDLFLAISFLRKGARMPLPSILIATTVGMRPGPAMGRSRSKPVSGGSLIDEEHLGSQGPDCPGRRNSAGLQQISPGRKAAQASLDLPSACFKVLAPVVGSDSGTSEENGGFTDLLSVNQKFNASHRRPGFPVGRPSANGDRLIACNLRRPLSVDCADHSRHCVSRIPLVIRNGAKILCSDNSIGPPPAAKGARMPPPSIVISTAVGMRPGAARSRVPTVRQTGDHGLLIRDNDCVDGRTGLLDCSPSGHKRPLFPSTDPLKVANAWAGSFGSKDLVEPSPQPLVFPASEHAGSISRQYGCQSFHRLRILADASKRLEVNDARQHG